jgi:hypothetical protein
LALRELERRFGVFIGLSVLGVLSDGGRTGGVSVSVMGFHLFFARVQYAAWMRRSHDAISLHRTQISKDLCALQASAFA